MTNLIHIVVLAVTSLVGFHTHNSQSRTCENEDFIPRTHDYFTCPNNRDISQIFWSSLPGETESKEVFSIKEEIVKIKEEIITNVSKSFKYEEVLRNAYTCGMEENDIEKKEFEMDVKEKDHISKVISEREWTKNFASVDCGAKLVKSGELVKHAGHIINKNHDEYMITECGEESDFVIELCDNIKITRLELDNFELYSGSPKNFSVFTMDKFSSNHEDWHFLGNFQASEEKMKVQEFDNLDLRSFGRYLRVAIHSYHGTEHFCTLTTFRVFGVTEYEFLSLDDEETS